MNRILSRRSLLSLAVILAIALFAVYLEARPRLAPGQEPLADIQDIDTLRTQFDHDSGKVRLIILVSPT